MDGATEPKEKNFIRTPQWYFRQFLPNARSLTQAKIVGEIINQTRGYHKPEDISTLTHLAKSVKMSRGTVSAHIQILLEVGVIQMRNEYGDELVDPVIRKISGIKRLRSIFVVPASLVLTEDKLSLLRTPRKSFQLVLNKDMKLIDNTTSERLNIRHNKRNNPKEIITKETKSDASHLHSHKLVPPYKKGPQESIEVPGTNVSTKPEVKSTDTHCSQCGKEISQAVIDYTLQEYGMVLCFNCSRGRSPL